MDLAWRSATGIFHRETLHRDLGKEISSRYLVIPERDLVQGSCKEISCGILRGAEILNADFLQGPLTVVFSRDLAQRFPVQ
jgi:hypothetical protein